MPDSRATSCITSDGTHAARPCVPTRRIRTSSAGYLLVPGLRSSRIHVIDTKPDPRSPKIVKVIEAEEIATRAGYSRPHTFHCGPDAILRERHGRRERRRPRWSLPARSRKFRRARPVGGRPRPAISRLRFLVAHAATTSESAANGARPTCSRTGSAWNAWSKATTAIGSTSGTCASAAISRKLTLARSIRWRSSCGRRTIRPRPTASSAPSYRPRTSAPESGYGIAKTATANGRRAR